MARMSIWLMVFIFVLIPIKTPIKCFLFHPDGPRKRHGKKTGAKCHVKKAGIMNVRYGSIPVI
jgi:hypothetical protein